MQMPFVLHLLAAPIRINSCATKSLCSLRRFKTCKRSHHLFSSYEMALPRSPSGRLRSNRSRSRHLENKDGAEKISFIYSKRREREFTGS
jgi:hypothetical protein